MSRFMVFAALPLLFVLFLSGTSWALASNNIPLDSPVYIYLEKLSGFGLIDSDINGLKPFSRAEAARLTLEAEGNLEKLGPQSPELAGEIVRRLRELMPREVDLRTQEENTPLFDWNPYAGFKLRYVYLDGVPRSFKRKVKDPGGDGIFGIGKGFRPSNPPGTTVPTNGTEGTPLLENNEGIIYKNHHNLELRSSAEFYFTRYVSALVEPLALAAGIGGDDGTDIGFRLNKGYIKLGGKGLELEAGRDANWFGQGFRGATVLSDNAPNLGMIKLSSPEPIGWRWLRENIGLVKYAFIFSRLKESGSGADLRRPWLVAFKLAVKPSRNFEIGLNVGRQSGGPNVKMGGNIVGILFGGQSNDGSNFVGGIDFRLRIPSLRNTTLYFEYAGEDAATFWPFVESYIGGVYFPLLTRDGRNDLRFEFYYGNRIAYTDYQYPEGYTNGDLILGHPEGGDTKEYFARYTHYFTERNRVALEYFHTQRGRLGRAGDEQVEEKDAGRVFWSLPLNGNWDLQAAYGYENIRNFDLEAGNDRDNHLFRVDVSYSY